MTSRVGRGQPPLKTRFKKGQSGNPGGRPRKVRDHKSAFSVLDRTLTTVREGKLQELSVDEALQHKTWQKAMGGDRRAQREVLKMIVERETELVKRRPKPVMRKVLVEYFDPKNAFEALRLLGIGADVENNFGYPFFKLETWAVQAALDRRSLTKLSESQIADIKSDTRDPDALRWPRRFHHD